MLNFGQKVAEKSNDVIPKNTLLWGVINIREIKNSRETNGRYLDIEMTVADNIPYARRKVWTKIADPFDSNNSEEWRTMGYGAIRRILEAVKGATPDNANSYVLNQLQDIHGLMVPFMVTVEKAKDGYDDKNGAEFLSPFSSVKKIVESFKLLQAGTYLYGKAETAPAPGQNSMFTGTGAPPPVAAPNQPPAAAAPSAAGPGWLAPPAAANPPTVAPAQVAPASFSPGQPVIPQTSGSAPAAAAPAPAPAANMAAVATPASTSPSNWSPPPAQFPGAQ